MSPTLATFLFELINFLVLVGLLGWLLFAPVRAALRAKQDAERQRREELAARAAEVAQQRADLEQRLRAFEAEMAAMRQQHLAAATGEAAAIRARAHDAAGRERDSARRALAQLERAQLERLSAAVATAARQSVARLLVTLGAVDLDTSLVDAACRQVAALKEGIHGTVLVESAHPLDEAARTAIITALDGRTDPQFRVLPDLGAGLRIVTSRGLIDASALGVAREAERMLTDALAVGPSEATI